VHQVAGHQFGAVDLAAYALALGDDPVLNKLLERLSAGFGLPFLDGADDRIDLQNREDEQGVGPFANNQGYNGGRQ